MKYDSAVHAEVVAFYLEVGSHSRGAEGLDVTTCVPPNSHSSCYRDSKQTLGRPEQRRGRGRRHCCLSPERSGGWARGVSIGDGETWSHSRCFTRLTLREKIVHTVRFHLYQIVEIANRSIAMEGCLETGRRGGEGLQRSTAAFRGDGCVRCPDCGDGLVLYT